MTITVRAVADSAWTTWVFRTLVLCALTWTLLRVESRVCPVDRKIDGRITVSAVIVRDADGVRRAILDQYGLRILSRRGECAIRLSALEETHGLEIWSLKGGESTPRISLTTREHDAFLSFLSPSLGLGHLSAENGRLELLLGNVTVGRAVRLRGGGPGDSVIEAVDADRGVVWKAPKR